MATLEYQHNDIIIIIIIIVIDSHVRVPAHCGRRECGRCCRHSEKQESGQPGPEGGDNHFIEKYQNEKPPELLYIIVNLYIMHKYLLKTMETRSSWLNCAL